MRITFLGTSHGVPAADRYCFCAMIEIGKDVYFIDAGASVVDEVLRRGLDIGQVKAIFTTHAHGDHTAGIFQYADLLNWYYKENKTEFYLTDPAIMELVERYIQVVEYGEMDSDRVLLKLATEGVMYEDANLKITYIPTKHLQSLGKPAYAILVEAENKKVLFTGDMSGGLEQQDFPAIASEQEMDVVVSEMAHFGWEDLRPYMNTMKTKELWIAHVFPISKFDEIREKRSAYPYPIYIAKDNDIIEL